MSACDGGTNGWDVLMAVVVFGCAIGFLPLWMWATHRWWE